MAPDPAPSTPESSPALGRFQPFARLAAEDLAAFEGDLQLCRYRLGQVVMRADVMPEGLVLLRSGTLRSLAADPLTDELHTIEMLRPGALAGWCGLLRGAPCEELRASSEVELLVLPDRRFRALLEAHPTLHPWFADSLPGAELYRLLDKLHPQEPQWLSALRHWPGIRSMARVRSVPPGGEQPPELDGDLLWYAGNGERFAERWPGQPPLTQTGVPAGAWLRLVGLPPDGGPLSAEDHAASDAGPAPAPVLVIGQPERPEPASSAAAADPSPAVPPEGEAPASGGEYALSPAKPPPRAAGPGELRLARASGPSDVPKALVLALARYFGLPVNRDSLRDQIQAVLERQGRLNLLNLGQILDSLGLRVVLTELPHDRLARAVTPAVLHREGHFALFDGVEPDGRLRLLEPELGPVLLPASQLDDGEGGRVQILLLQRKPDAKEER
ncbi:MAG: cyclic nucleotide-binding domain-containing protein, partial [Cyanobium sp.]